jgi:hypothetical protein
VSNDGIAAQMRGYIARHGPDTVCSLAISVPLRAKSRPTRRGLCSVMKTAINRRKTFRV